MNIPETEPQLVYRERTLWFSAYDETWRCADTNLAFKSLKRLKKEVDKEISGYTENVPVLQTVGSRLREQLKPLVAPTQT